MIIRGMETKLDMDRNLKGMARKLTMRHMDRKHQTLEIMKETKDRRKKW
jgi:hypothetical protein